MVIGELAVKARRNRLAQAPPNQLCLRRCWAIATVSHHSRTAKERNNMAGLRYLILSVIDIYWWVIIAQAVMSWLVAFGVINTYNKFVAQVGEMLYRLTEPALRPIRNFLPNLGGIDISPIILLLLLGFLRFEIAEYFP